jgi:hypothetical protein
MRVMQIVNVDASGREGNRPLNRVSARLEERPCQAQHALAALNSACA